MRDAQWVMRTLKMMSENVAPNQELQSILKGCLELVMEHDNQKQDPFAEVGTYKPKKPKTPRNPEDTLHARDLPKTLSLGEVSDFLDHKAEVGVPFWRKHPKEWYVTYLQEQHKIEITPWN